MQQLFSYRKPICLIVLVSLYWLCIAQTPAQAALITTEDTIDWGSEADYDRARIKAFVSRKDVIVQLQSYGISPEEALARVDSLTDQEIAIIIGKIDKLPAGGNMAAAMEASIIQGANAAAAQIALYALIAAAIIAVILAIIAYALEEGPNKPTYKEF